MMRSEKVKKVSEIEEVLGAAKGVYLAEFEGMSVAIISELRKRCREANVRFEVVKNTLLRRAVAETGHEGILPHIVGTTALATSAVDEIAPARVLNDFRSEFKLPRVKGGLVDGSVFDEEQVKSLAALPSREILLGNFLRALQGTLTNFASVLQAPLRDLARVLDQVAKQKEGAA
ncbi:MAG: 50S ribosomal protein L10 [Candidatus Eisenbacteria sp.]|nr:50S ribosomal protein L10 [Candidatus Eisenbacteria bacterium]